MFSNLLNETKGFKYQIIVNVLLKKDKHNGEIEFAPVYLNSFTKTMFGLIKDVTGVLNQSSFNTLTFLLIEP